LFQPAGGFQAHQRVSGPPVGFKARQRVSEIIVMGAEARFLVYKEPAEATRAGRLTA
jgi:hypothetical protein